MLTSPPRTGFTLIEVSIVLVIIGLIIGGVLVGRDLIRAAEVRATIAQFERFNVAANAFRNKYNCLPGDCPTAGEFGIDPLSAGNGDGFIGPCADGNISSHTGCFTGYDECASPIAQEMVNFWYHLSAASLIDFAGAPGYAAYCDPANDATTPWADRIGYTAGVATPPARIGANGGKAGWIVKGELRFTPPDTAPGPPPQTIAKTMNAHTLVLGVSVTSPAMTRDVQAGFYPIDIRAIDEKLDDGKPASGSVQIIEGDYFVGFGGVPGNAHGQVYTNAEYACGNEPNFPGARCTCNVNGGTDWQYNLAVAPTMRFCVPAMRASF